MKNFQKTSQILKWSLFADKVKFLKICFIVRCDSQVLGIVLKMFFLIVYQKGEVINDIKKLEYSSTKKPKVRDFIRREKISDRSISILLKTTEQPWANSVCIGICNASLLEVFLEEINVLRTFAVNLKSARFKNVVSQATQYKRLWFHITNNNY